MPFDTLACQFETLACCMARWHVYWHVCMFTGTLARKNEKLARFWHVGTQAHCHVNHAGTQAHWHIDHVGTLGTRFSKLQINLFEDML